MDAPVQELTFTAGALLCASIASVFDLRERRIPNSITGPAITVGLVTHSIAGGWSGLGDSLLAGLVAGAIFLTFFVAGGMGAGDVKLMTAVGCIAGLSPLRLVVIATAIAGGLLALAISSYRGRMREMLQGAGAVLMHHGQHGLVPHPDLNLVNPRTLRLPFALPIAAGCLFALCALVWEARS